MDLKTEAWNQSYKNKDNFIFYPNEDIVRFISKYIKKQIGINKFIDKINTLTSPKVLDFGCGIGRHVKLLNEFNLDAFGIDLSTEAINNAKTHFKQQHLADLVNKVVVGEITNLPYEDVFFDFMLSHGVLDSMPFQIAKKSMLELHRCAKNGAYIYFDLIATDDSSFSGNYEQIIKTSHEQNTIQYYYDIEKIAELIDNLFTIEEIILNNKKNMANDFNIARYHITVQKV